MRKTKDVAIKQMNDIVEEKPWPSLPDGIKPYYLDDAVCIIHGDCRDVVPQLGRFDLLLTENNYLTDITTWCMLWV